jgi:hypothetical protein
MSEGTGGSPGAFVAPGPLEPTDLISRGDTQSNRIAIALVEQSTRREIGERLLPHLQRRHGRG